MPGPRDAASALTGAAGPALRRRDRFSALGGLVALAAAAWLYLWIDASRMAGMDMSEMAMASMNPPVHELSPWSPPALLAVFVMWAVMMVAMMLPSALPAILLFGAVAAGRGSQRPGGAPLARLSVFAAGYVAVWTAFSAAATLGQAALASAGWLTAMMSSASVWLSALVLAVAGAYQWLPVKDACLRFCRSPLELFLFRFRPGAGGAFAMGAEHGVYCVGCCWALMLVLFAAGVMNLLWVALLAGLVLLEKVLPGGRWIGRVAGVGLLGLAVATAAGAPTPW